MASVPSWLPASSRAAWRPRYLTAYQRSLLHAADLLAPQGPAGPDVEAGQRFASQVSFLDLVTRTFHGYQADPAHRLVMRHLEDLTAGRLDRLMILAPPQHGKSLLAAVYLPVYHLAHHPDAPIIISSYGAKLAESKSRQARDLVESETCRRLYPHVDTARDSRSVQLWRLAYPHRGQVVAAGVGGPITGHGAFLGIVDDPHENWQQAQSQTMRDMVWDWWRGTFRTRVWDGGRIVLIMTRWHADDLAGRLLSEQREAWTVLRLPAIAETQEERDEANRRLGFPAGLPDPLGRAPGEPLAPSRFSLEALLRIRREVGSLVWAAEYQGSPTVREGLMFRRSWFQIVGAAPRDARRVRYWDKAATPGGGAYTAGVLVAMDAEGRVYVEDVKRGQWSALERERIIKQTALEDAMRYGDVRWRDGGREYEIWDYGVDIWLEQEPGASGVESAQATIRNLAGFNVRAETPSGSKDVRLEPFRAQAEAGNVYLVQGAWNPAYLDELAELPNGAYRDQADATAGAFNKLNQASWLLA